MNMFKNLFGVVGFVAENLSPEPAAKGEGAQCSCEHLSSGHQCHLGPMGGLEHRWA